MLPITGNTSSAGKKPTTPTIGTVTAGVQSASVAFTPSTYIGKGTITYTATSNPSEITGTGSSSPITVSGLTAGTPYTFTVVGNANYGVLSDASAFSSPVTPTAPAPTYAIAPNSTSVNEGATVTFTITTTNFGSGTLYFTLEGVSGTINNADFSSPANAVSAGGSVTITDNSGSFAVVLSNDLTTEGVESFRANLRPDSVFGFPVANSATVTVADTSLTPPPPPPPATNPPATNPPATNPPATNPPATNPPATTPPATNPPATTPPATNPPVTPPPSGCRNPCPPPYFGCQDGGALCAV